MLDLNVFISSKKASLMTPLEVLLINFDPRLPACISHPYTPCVKRIAKIYFCIRANQQEK